MIFDADDAIISETELESPVSTRCAGGGSMSLTALLDVHNCYGGKELKEWRGNRKMALH